MTPKLSVITPSLNQGAFIERTIRSVLDQGYPDLEYVIVDGGSTDGTLDVIRRYEDRLAWWVSEPDEGQTDAINKGIRRTSGEIVAYLNSDDYYQPGAFERAMSAFESPGARWVAGASDNVDANGDPLPTGMSQAMPPSFFEDTPRGRGWWLLSPWRVPQPSTFWRRDLFDEYGLFREDMHYAFDAEFMVRLVLAGEHPVLLTDEVLAARTLHGEAKAADPSRWAPEVDQMIKLHRHLLSPAERRRLAVARGLRRIGYFRFRNAVVHPVLRIAGRARDRALPR
jgi:glycosyltransferase involved in cell wall biosynthesis